MIEPSLGAVSAVYAVLSVAAAVHYAHTFTPNGPSRTDHVSWTVVWFIVTALSPAYWCYVVGSLLGAAAYVACTRVADVLYALSVRVNGRFP